MFNNSLARRFIIFVKLIVEESPNNPIDKRFRKTVIMKKGLNSTKFFTFKISPTKQEILQRSHSVIKENFCGPFLEGIDNFDFDKTKRSEVGDD